MLRTASVEAIAKSLGAKTATWYGREPRGRIPAEEAATALCGIPQPALAYWLWSVGHHEPEHASVIAAHLRGLFADRWPERRFMPMLALCMGELSDGYAIHGESAEQSEAERYRRIGVSESSWYSRGWRNRYREMLRAALDQIAIAQTVMGPRLTDV